MQHSDTLQQVLSLVFYIISFCCSCCFTFFAEKKLNTNNKLEFYFWSILAILIPCLVAGLRNISVGTDTENYFYIYKSIAEVHNYSMAFETFGLQGFRPLFILFAKLVYEFFDSYNVFLFIMQLTEILPIYFIALKRRNIAPMWSYLFVYYFMFFNMSLNIMRQVISASYMLLSFLFLQDKKYFKFLFCCLISSAFHQSFFLPLVVFSLYGVYKVLKPTIGNKTIGVLIFAVCLLVVYNISSLLVLLAEQGLLSGRGASFLMTILSNSSTYGNSPFKGLNLSAYAVIFMRFFLALGTYLLVKKKFRTNDFSVLFIVLLFNAFFYGLISLLFNTYYIYRIMLYFDYYFIIFLPYLVCNQYRHGRIGINFHRISVNELFFVISLVSYWAFAYIYHGYDYTHLYFVGI